jgi:hypothetical protein
MEIKVLAKVVWKVCTILECKPFCSLKPLRRRQGSTYVDIPPEEQQYYYNAPDEDDGWGAQQTHDTNVDRLVKPNYLISITDRRREKTAPFIHRYWEPHRPAYRTEEGSEELRRAYGDIYAHFDFRRYTAVVEESDEKISLAIFRHHRTRCVGSRYFKIGKNNVFVNYNKRTKNFTIRNGKWIRCNYINGLTRLANAMEISTVDLFLSGPDYGSRKSIEPKPIVNRQLLEVINTFLGAIGAETIIEIDKENIQKVFIDMFLKQKEVHNVPTARKYDLMKYYYPGAKFLKKHKNDFIRALLYSNGIYNRWFYKLIKNDNAEYRIDSMIVLWKIFGDISYLRLLGIEWAGKICETELTYKEIPLGETLSHQEKLNLIAVMKQDPSFTIMTFLSYLMDIERIRKVFPKYKLRLPGDVVALGIQIADVVGLRQITKRWLDFNFPSEFVEYIQKPFDDFYPILIRNDFQIHVERKTAYFRPHLVDSFYISLRRGSRSSKERVTLWFRYGSANNFNQVPAIEDTSPIFIKTIDHRKKLDPNFTSAIDFLKQKVYNSVTNVSLKRPTLNTYTHENTNGQRADEPEELF